MPGKIIFDESMSGFLSLGSAEPSRGFRAGREQGRVVRGDFRITIDNVDRFITHPEHEARLDGALAAHGFGEDLEVKQGRFNLFIQDPTRVRHMIYLFDFQAGGETYAFNGRKEITDDAHALDAVEDMTTLYTRIHRGSGTAPGAVVAAGILRFHIRDLPMLLASIQTPEDTGLDRVAVVHKFFGFALGELAQTYLFAFK